ncbi:MAG TPA: TIGR04255 family protein [Balneolales bacterium]|nr:TIGR04255 family protein [Balneolales bacterium]
MSRLPSAPLLEVIFELRWKILNQSDLAKSQYLHGDLYSILKTDYPFRESLAPPEVPAAVLVNKPVYRFRRAKDEYPLIQIGPGLLTLNTTDEEYFWGAYFESSTKLLNAFYNAYSSGKEIKVAPSLAYVDFFQTKSQEENIIQFINDNLAIKINQGFFKENRPPNNLNLGINYNIDFGSLSINLNTGKNSKQQSGLILQTKIIGKENNYTSDGILSWLKDAHEMCSRLFKNMTKGQLYETFKMDQL